MKKVSSTQTLSVPKFPIGLEKHVNKLKEYIFQGRRAEKNVICVGILGMAGIGKSTLAKALYNRICSNFSRACYIEDVKGQFEKNGWEHIQQSLLRQLLRYDFKVWNPSHGKEMLRKKLNRKDALIVYDNIEYSYQIDDILFEDVLHPGSTIIVTTRDQSIFRRWNNYLKYESSTLNFWQSKELFCRHAFHSDHPFAPLESLANQFVNVCRGLPLALEVYGGRLYSQPYANWINFWKRVFEKELQSILRVSYELIQLELGWIKNSRELPQSIGELSNLRIGFLWDCPNLERLSTSIGDRRLKEIIGNLCRLPLLERLPPSFHGSPSSLTSFELNNCPRGKEVDLGHLQNLCELNNLSSFSGLEYISGVCASRNLSYLNLSGCHNLHEIKQLTTLKVHVSEAFSWENHIWLENLPPRVNVHFTASAIPYVTPIVNPSYIEATSAGQELRFQLLPTSKTCIAIIIGFVSVFLVDEFDKKFLPPAIDFEISWDGKDIGGTYTTYIHDFKQAKIGELINLGIFKMSDYHHPFDLEDKTSVRVSAYTEPLRSSPRVYLKGWMRRIGEGEEYMIHNICSAFFKEIRRQWRLSDAREHAPSQLNLLNLHALDIANCRIRRLCLLNDTPIQVEEMELVYRSKQLIWGNDEVLKHLDLSIVDTNLPCTIKSMANLYKMEVMISSRGKVVHKDELQEYDKDALVNRHDEISFQFPIDLEIYASNLNRM
eukprot:Gb_14969 [translate_table: standard]